jgi:phosphoglycolate phosphatase
MPELHGIIASPQLQGIIFDLDGTLLDTLEDLAAAGNLALAAHDLPPQPMDRYRLLVGAGARQLILRATRAAGREWTETDSRIDAMVETFKKAYASRWHEQTRLYPGVLHLLNRLAGSGVPLAVLSNKPDEFTQQIVAHFFPKNLFAAVIGLSARYPAKPDPETSWQICRLINSEPARTALVGDSGSDMETAVRGGLVPLGVLWGFRERAELIAGGARQLFAEPADLEAWLYAGRFDASGGGGN